MKAAVWHERGTIRIENVPVPDPGPGQVRLAVSVCSICGTDLHEYRQGPFLIPTRPHPLTGRCQGPVVLGHEFSARVDALGEGVSGFATGDRVTVNALIYCGRCAYCRNGQYNMCTKLGTVGFASDGAFAEYLVVPDYTLHRLPDAVSDEAGALTEPLAVAVRAVKRARVELGKSVCVIGAGPVGLLVMQVCKAAGASQIFVTEPMPQRQKLARALGATQVLDPTQENPGKVIAQATDNLRADVAIDCVGSQASFDTAVKVTGRRATICVVGLSVNPVQVPFLRLWGHEKEITFTTGYVDEFPPAIALLAQGRVQTEPLITSRIDLQHLIQDGLLMLAEQPQQHVKIMVYPHLEKA